MRKKKFLELLENDIKDFDAVYKKKIINKYNIKIIHKMKRMTEKEAVETFDRDVIVRKEKIIFKVKMFFINIINIVVNFFKSFSVKIRNIKNKNNKNLHKKVEKLSNINKKKKDINDYNKYNTKLSVFLMVVLNIFFGIVLFILGIFFFINIIAILDGVRLFSFIITTFLLMTFIILLLLFLNSILHKTGISFKKYYTCFITLLVLLGCSIGYIIYDIYKLEEIDDLSDNYVMSSESITYDLLENDVLDIEFNHNYNNTYNIKYDNTLNDEVKIVANYYRTYHDYFVTRNRNDIYVSFHANKRNVISAFIEGLREDKIFNFNELKRYNITIYVNENDKDRINVY